MEVQNSDFCSLHNGREAWAVNDSLSDIIKDTDCMLQFANQQDESSEEIGLFNQVFRDYNLKIFLILGNNYWGIVQCRPCNEPNSSLFLNNKKFVNFNLKGSLSNNDCYTSEEFKR